MWRQRVRSAAWGLAGVVMVAGLTGCPTDDPIEDPPQNNSNNDTSGQNNETGENNNTSENTDSNNTTPPNNTDPNNTTPPNNEPTPEFCQLQAQSPVTAIEGMPTPVLYALVYKEGVTVGMGPGSGITAELGWGQGTDYESFAYESMAYNVDVDGLTPGDLSNDEYGAPGHDRRAGRVSIRGAGAL